MGTKQGPPESFNVRKSPSGRVPQWVLDEALGRPVEPVPFRGATVAGSPPRPNRRQRLLRRAAVTVLVLSVAGAAILYGRPIRALTAGSGSPLDLGSSQTVAKDPVMHQGPRYRFLQTQDGGSVPVTWPSCRPIHYVVRALHEPKGGRELLQQGLALTSQASGMRFVYDGPTSEDPSSGNRPIYQPARYGRRWAPVLVAWATPAEVADFGSDAAGLAGAAQVRASQHGLLMNVSGTVYLDPIAVAKTRAERGEAAARSIAMHELGHLLGLAHVADTREIMFPGTPEHPGEFGVGDKHGLAVLGKGPCLPEVAPYN
jgi:hypothetical protein